MKTGFQSSVRHVPQSARLRALCTQAPSSCQTMPTRASSAGRRAATACASPAPDGQDEQRKREHAASRRRHGLRRQTAKTTPSSTRSRSCDSSHVRSARRGRGRTRSSSARAPRQAPVVLLQARRGPGAARSRSRQQPGRAVAGRARGELDHHRPAPEEPRRAPAPALRIHAARCETEHIDAICRSRRPAGPERPGRRLRAPRTSSAPVPPKRSR